MNKTIFVVSKVGWEYNDEYYYRPQDESVLPEFAFTDINKALEYYEKKNLEFYKDLPLIEYGDGWQISEIFEQPGIDYLNSLNEDWYDQIKEGATLDLTEKEWKQLTPHIKIKFYEINEVELND